MSYATQLIGLKENVSLEDGTQVERTVCTSNTGTLCKDMVLGNLDKVQSYVEEDVVNIGGTDFVPEDDEFIAETVIITKDTGGDKVTSIVLTISITAGLAVIAGGIVLIKKYVIK